MSEINVTDQRHRGEPLKKRTPSESQQRQMVAVKQLIEDFAQKHGIPWKKPEEGK